MNTVLKILLALILLPLACCGSTCACVAVAGAYKKAKQ